jgi:Poly(A) polymerase catalytic subunit
MEEDIHTLSENVVKAPSAVVENRLKSAVETAQEVLDYEAAHNPEILKALNLVFLFLKRKGRVCYGGTAMNAILPPKRRFYSAETDLPDYDFFTPDIEADVRELAADLTKAGFKDVYTRLGIHEGTKKILVNYVPIADVTNLNPEVYAAFYKRSIIKGGVHYTDPDVLRMMMYLEISRPKGMVSRWEKVYERLQLINETFPPKVSTIRRGATRKLEKAPTVPRDVRHLLLNYCIEHKRIVFTGGLDNFYKSVIERKVTTYHPDAYKGVVGFITHDVKKDAVAIQKLLGGPQVAKGFLHKAKGDIVPEHIEIRYLGVPCVIFFKESACHAYLNFNTDDGRTISVATLDTLITLYYAISIFTLKSKTLIPGLDAQIPKFIHLAEENRRLKDPPIPSFPLTCRGYQKGFTTLLRERVVRMKTEKEVVKQKE